MNIGGVESSSSGDSGQSVCENSEPDLPKSHGDSGYEAKEVTERQRKSEEMSMVDWRWAAIKGYWDQALQRWNEEAGGKAAYLAQRGKRFTKRRGHSLKAGARVGGTKLESALLASLNKASRSALKKRKVIARIHNF